MHAGQRNGPMASVTPTAGDQASTTSRETSAGDGGYVCRPEDTGSTYFDYAMKSYPGISVIARPLSYPLLASGPLFVTMVGMGFAYREMCPLHDRIPKFLFFAGLAGTFAVILRLLLIIKWRSIKAKYDKNYDPNNHPAFGMVRCIMYLCIIFTAFYNFYTTPYVLAITHIERGCDPRIYNFTYAVIIAFNFICGTWIFLWLSSMFTGIFYPEMLIDYFYDKGILPPDVLFIKRSWSATENEGNAADETDSGGGGGNNNSPDATAVHNTTGNGSNSLKNYGTAAPGRNTQPASPPQQSAVSLKHQLNANQHWMEEEKKAWVGGPHFQLFQRRHQSTGYSPSSTFTSSTVPTSSIFPLAKLSKKSSLPSLRESTTKLHLDSVSIGGGPSIRFSALQFGESNGKAGLAATSTAAADNFGDNDSNYNHQNSVRFSLEVNHRRISGSDDGTQAAAAARRSTSSGGESCSESESHGSNSRKSSINSSSKSSRFTSTPVDESSISCLTSTVGVAVTETGLPASSVSHLPDATTKTTAAAEETEPRPPPDVVQGGGGSRFTQTRVTLGHDESANMTTAAEDATTKGVVEQSGRFSTVKIENLEHLPPIKID